MKAKKIKEQAAKEKAAKEENKEDETSPPAKRNREERGRYGSVIPVNTEKSWEPEDKWKVVGTKNETGVLESSKPVMSITTRVAGKSQKQRERERMIRDGTMTERGSRSSRMSGKFSRPSTRTSMRSDTPTGSVANDVIREDGARDDASDTSSGLWNLQPFEPVPPSRDGSHTERSSTREGRLSDHKPGTRGSVRPGTRETRDSRASGSSWHSNLPSDDYVDAFPERPASATSSISSGPSSVAGPLPPMAPQMAQRPQTSEVNQRIPIPPPRGRAGKPPGTSSTMGRPATVADSAYTATSTPGLPSTAGGDSNHAAGGAWGRAEDMIAEQPDQEYLEHASSISVPGAYERGRSRSSVFRPRSTVDIDMNSSLTRPPTEAETANEEWYAEWQREERLDRRNRHTSPKRDWNAEKAKRKAYEKKGGILSPNRSPSGMRKSAYSITQREPGGDDSEDEDGNIGRPLSPHHILTARTNFEPFREPPFDLHERDFELSPRGDPLEPTIVSQLEEGENLRVTDRARWEMVLGIAEQQHRKTDASPRVFDRYGPANPNLEPSIERPGSGITREFGGATGVGRVGDYPYIDYDQEIREKMSSRGSSRSHRSETIASQTRAALSRKASSSVGSSRPGTGSGGRPPWKQVGGWDGSEAGPAPPLPARPTFDFSFE